MHLQVTFVAVCCLLLIIHTCGEHATAKLSQALFFSDPDEHLTFEELIAFHGFSLQSYSVTTEDGYILTLHRVVTQDYSSGNYSKTRKPVIVWHGMFGSSNNFFINSPYLYDKDNPNGCGDNFGFCLVLTGRYDVWLPNSRGNGYSDGHKSGMSSCDHDYWNFSFDQMAEYDAPAAIDFVRQATGYEKIGYIGMSQGTNIMFGLLSLRPEYARVIQPYIAWAPPIYIDHMTSVTKYLVPFAPVLHLTGGQFFLSYEIFAKLTEVSCGVVGFICDGILDALMGKSTSVNETRLPVYFHYFPSSVSSWQLVHYAQLYNTGEFIRFDYGTTNANIAAYGKAKPPLYPLENIPPNYTIALIRGNTDAYVAQEDAERLIRVLRDGNVNVIDYVAPREAWSHTDNVIGMGAGRLVNDKMIELLDQYSA